MKKLEKKEEAFTSPFGKIQYCNQCKKPILIKGGRFHVDITFDSKNSSRLMEFGYKTFCPKCFRKLFKEEEWEGARAIFK